MHTTKSDTYLNYRLLREAVESYICDVDRLICFRSVNNADEHKKAAYLIKWICKIKPIQVVLRKNQNEADEYCRLSNRLANELYAVTLGLSELNCRNPGGRLSPGYLRNLLYLLHHHTVDADFLASELYVVERHLNGQPI